MEYINKEGESQVSPNSVTTKTLNSTLWAARFDGIFALGVQFIDIQRAITKTMLLNE